MPVFGAVLGLSVEGWVLHLLPDPFLAAAFAFWWRVHRVLSNEMRTQSRR